MKITKIHLENFHQFENLDIDLTYPKGHKKEGEPLEKVCFIGQSGTGKTSLLKLIAGHTFTLRDLFIEYNPTDFQNVKVFKKLNNLTVEVSVTRGKKELEYNHRYFDSRKLTDFKTGLLIEEEYLSKIKTHFIYFPADLKYENIEAPGKNIADKKVIDFSKDKLGDIWAIILAEIQAYQESELKLRQAISKVAESSKTMVEIQKAVKKLDEWRKKEFNPIKSIAENCLDPLLKNFELRVKQNLDFEKKDDLGFIKIEDLKGNLIPHGLLSTGTKQVLLTAMPLYLLKPDNTLILCDEPERSLYPSVQRLIIDYYTSLTKDSQFFFSTHSPIIASCFEPWEIVELKFDKNGIVYQDLYYDINKERHVDNYTIIPSYLTFDLMLSKVFDLKETHSEKRSEKITEVLMLRNQLLKIKRTDPTLKSKKAIEIYKRYYEISSRLFWEFDIN